MVNVTTQRRCGGLMRDAASLYRDDLVARDEHPTITTRTAIR
jgi:hypothetical protein